MQHYWNYLVKLKQYQRLRRIISKKLTGHYQLHLDKGKINYSQKHQSTFFRYYRFDYTVKKQGWGGGGTRSVKFTHGTTATPVVRLIDNAFH